MSFSVFQKVRALMPHEVARYAYRVVRPDRYGEFEALRTTPLVEGTNISFIPLQQTRSIFVHIPKAAGTSVGGNLYGCFTGHHMTLLDYRTAFPQDFYKNAFKFTFIRNPWDRLVSAFFYLKDSIGIDFNDNEAGQSVSRYDTFEEFVLDFVAHEDINKFLHLREQHLFLRLPGRGIGVDFVGRYERLYEDFRFVARRLGKDIKLEHRNASALRKTDYRDIYTSRSIDIVARTYAKDIDYFGYTFEGDLLHGSHRN